MTERRTHAGEQHPEEWRRDLNPDPNAGVNYGAPSDLEQGARVAYDIKEFHDLFPNLSAEELRDIPVLAPGMRLEQGATYIDLSTPDPHEFTATGDLEAGPGNWFVPKSEVPYQTWNKLIGVKNPERLGEADED